MTCRILATLAGLGSVSSSFALAQANPLPVEEVVGMHTFSEWTPVTFSPNSKLVAFAVKNNLKIGTFSLDQMALSGVPFNALSADIFVASVEGGEERNVTERSGNNWAPAWSPDGRWLAFISDRDGSGQARLWLWETLTGKLRKVSDVSVRANEIEWLPDSKRIAVTALPEGVTPEKFAERVIHSSRRQREGRSEHEVPGSTVVVYESKSAESKKASQMESAWNLDYWLHDLVVVDLDSGKWRVVDHGHRITKVRLSPDGSRVAITIPNRFASGSSQQILFDLNVYSVDHGDGRTLAADIQLLYNGASFNWSPDSSHLVYQAGGVEATGDCYLLDIKGGPPKNISGLASHLNHWASPPLWGREGRLVYFLHEDAIWQASPDGQKATQLAKIPHHRLFEIVAAKEKLFSPDNHALEVLTYDDEVKQSGFYKVDLDTGKAAKLREESQAYFAYSRQDNVSTSPDGKHVAFFSEDAQHPKDLWLANSDFGELRRLSDINHQLDGYQMGSARLIGWTSIDGEKLHGALLLPSTYEAGKKYPLIVCVYGGDSLSDWLNQFGFGLCGVMNMQLFATRGYAVLLPDAPQHLGTPMLDLAKSILPGVNKVVDMGVADPDRLGLMGHSYGGYSVLSLIVQTKRFKAAMAAAGYGDLIAGYGQMRSDGSTYAVAIAEQGQGLMGGTPWQFRDRYVENSPLFYLDRVETPVLLVHGAEDEAVASFLADEIFVGMRRLGKDVVYAKYGKESHSPQIWSYENQIDYSTRVLEWFNRYLTK